MLIQIYYTHFSGEIFKQSIQQTLKVTKESLINSWLLNVFEGEKKTTKKITRFIKKIQI